MEDELKKGIMALLDAAEIIIKAPPEFYAMKDKVTLAIDGKAGIADDILSLLAPELEKARKWDRVKEIAKYGHKTCSRECPAWDFCYDGLCQNVFEVVEALEEEGEKEATNDR